MLAVLKVPPGHEFEFESRLSKNGVKVYCPKIPNWVRNRKSSSESDRFICRHTPMLPGYVLVDETTLELPWGCFIRAKYITMNDKVLMISETQFKEIQEVEREISSSFDVKFNKSGLILSIGDMVKMTVGALSGLCGRVVFVNGKMIKISFKDWPLDLLVPVSNVVLYKVNQL